MAADTIIGAGLAPSPYAELRAENERLRRDLAAAREALREVHTAGRSWRARDYCEVQLSHDLLATIGGLFDAAPAEPKEDDSVPI